LSKVCGLSVCLCCLCCLWAGPLWASGFSVARFSGEHGHPTTDNPTALYFNPAALRAERPELLVDGLFGYRRATYARQAQPSDAPDPSDAQGANVGLATLDNFLANPSLWFMLPVTQRLTLGAGVYTVLGGPVNWDKRSDFESSPYPGAVDGVSRFHSMEGQFTVSYASLGASYGLGESGWRLGLALNGVYTRIDDVRAWSGGSNGLKNEGRSLLEVDGIDWSFGAGVFYECACKHFRFGLSYQSRPNVASGQKLDGKLSNDIGGPSSASVQLHEDLPDSVRIGVSYQPQDNLELRAFGTWERWSAFERQCVTEKGADCRILPDGSQPNGSRVLTNVPRDFHDAFEARLGLSVWSSPRWEWLSGIGVMSQAVPSSTLETSLPDFTGVTFSLGARAKLSDKLAVGLGLSHIVSPSRDAHSTLQNNAAPSQLPSASGHYTQSVSYADLNAAVRF
jgi:long-chain fatty acid transport protein